MAQVAQETPAKSRKMHMAKSEENCGLHSYQRLVSRRNPHFLLHKTREAAASLLRERLQMC
jgi:hypothetical protein